MVKEAYYNGKRGNIVWYVHVSLLCVLMCACGMCGMCGVWVRVVDQRLMYYIRESEQAREREAGRERNVYLLPP